MSKPYILCISGISTSGKSTIAKDISEKFGYKIIPFDDYFIDFAKIPKFQMDGQTIINWDLPESIDWDLILSDLQKLDPKKKYIIESFIPFASPQIEPLVDSLIDIEFYQTDFEVALKRRVFRGFNEDVPSDYNENPMSSKAHFCAYYFKNYVWKEAFLHPEYRLPLHWDKPLLRLSATDPLEDNLKSAYNFVENLPQESTCSVI